MLYNRLYTKLRSNFQLYSFPFAFALLTGFSAIAQAQIVPDNTLPNNSAIAPNGATIKITGGSTAGDNLFHSFEQFSVLEGQTAWFDNDTAVANIISRVTGGSVSAIEGLIKANGDANLFLINPNGIIFSENSALEIGGSFVATTADSLKFADDSEFSAVNSASPLLTVSIPVGLQLGSDSGDITVKGSGHDASFDFDTFTVDRSERNLGLAVAEGKTLALIGQNITLDGGNLTAVGGNIELGSISAAGTVNLEVSDSEFTFDFGELAGGKIDLIKQSSLDVSGNGSGNVMVRGDSIDLADGSAIFAETLGDTPGGQTRIEAKRVNITGSDADELLPSSIWSDVYFDATANGGSVQIEADSLLLSGGGQVNVNTYGLGNAGNLTVKTTDTQLTGQSPTEEFSTALYAQADIFLTGAGGNITVETDNLLVEGGAQIDASTFGDGDAGNLTIVADEVKLTGISLDEQPSGLSANAANADLDGTGNGGNIDLTVNSLILDDEAQININSENLGNGGNLNLTANSLVMSNDAQIEAGSYSEGDAGNVNLTVDNLELTNASGIYSTAEVGNGGDITISAAQLQMNNGALIVARTTGAGDGGNITVDADRLQISNGAQVAVTTVDSGNAGTLDITAGEIELDGSSDIASSGLFASALVGSGSGGNINLKSDRLSITAGATINAGNFPTDSTLTPGTGQTGNINLDVGTLQLDSSTVENPSSITVSANSQAGGNITLKVAEDASLKNGSQITATTQGEGDGGNIDLISDRLSLSQEGQVSVSSTGTGNAGNIAIAAPSFNLNQGIVTATATQAGGGEINLTTDSLLLENNSLISTSVIKSDGSGGNITVNNRDLIIGRDNSQIAANAVFGDGGNIQIDTKALFFAADSKITASSEFGVDGLVEINNIESANKLDTLQLVNNVAPPLAVVTSSCPVSKDNTFAITGRGGMATNPGQYLRGQTVWQDLRIPIVNNNNLSAANTASPSLVEARAWQIDRSGRVKLLAKTALRDRWGHEHRCSAGAID